MFIFEYFFAHVRVVHRRLDAAVNLPLLYGTRDTVNIKVIRGPNADILNAYISIEKEKYSFIPE